MSKFIWQNGSQIEPAKVEIGGTSYEVTPAQYEGETPLSAANLNTMVDNIYSDLQEYADNSPIKNNDYSTKEKVIGTWIDGKPIYRKVINIGKLQATKGAYSYNHEISNIAYFTKVEGIINNGTEWFPANSVYRGANNYTYDFGLLATKTKITCSTQTDRSAYSLIVTLEYTKTTD